jgi:spore coat protein U-like protein
VSGQTTLNATCTGQTPYFVALDNGLNGTSATARKMKSASSDLVTYGLYRDSARSLPWGTIATGQAQSGTGVGVAQVYTIYGQVPAQPTATAGTYTDRIVVTVTY